MEKLKFCFKVATLTVIVKLILLVSFTETVKAFINVISRAGIYEVAQDKHTKET